MIPRRARSSIESAVDADPKIREKRSLLKGAGLRRHLGNLEDFAVIGISFLRERELQNVERLIEALAALFARHSYGIELRFRDAPAQSYRREASIRYDIQNTRFDAPGG